MPYYPPSGGGSSSSAGLMGTGNFLVSWSSDPLLTNEKILTAGANITITTDTTTITLAATTGVAAASGGLAGTGFYYLVGSNQAGLPFSKVVTAGSSVTIHTDSTAFYINAITSLFAGSGGLASTGGYYAVWSSDPLLSNEKIITAGSSVTLHTDATAIYINATTSLGSSVVYAPSGGPYIAYTSDGTLSAEKILTAGSSVSIHTDSTFFYINALTGAGASSGGLAGTGSFYAVWSSDPLLSNEKVITAGSSVTLHTDAGAIYINATTSLGASSFLSVIKPTIQSISSSTLFINDNALVIPLQSASTYLIEILLFVTNTSTVPDFKIALKTSIDTVYYGIIRSWHGVGDASPSFITNANTASTTFPLTATDTGGFLIKSTFITNNSASSCQVQWAQAVSNIVPVSVLNYSYINAMKL